MAEFQDPNVNYTPLRESGQKGTRAQGTRPGQIKVVTSPLPYTETGMNKPVSQNNKASFILTGEKDGKLFRPHHVDGVVDNKIFVRRSGKYHSSTGESFSECSSSEEAKYEGEKKGVPNSKL